MSIGWREPDILRKKFEPFLVDLFTESKCWVCVPAILQKASCDYSSLGKPLIANCNYLYGMQCKTSLQSGALQFLQFPENRHENWWLFMEDAALDRARDMTVYGILDTNVESCQPYDFGKTFDEQKLTLPPDNPKAIKTMLPELLFGTARARMEKGAGFVTKTWKNLRWICFLLVAKFLLASVVFLGRLLLLWKLRIHTRFPVKRLKSILRTARCMEIKAQVNFLFVRCVGEIARNERLC